MGKIDSGVKKARLEIKLNLNLEKYFKPKSFILIRENLFVEILLPPRTSFYYLRGFEIIQFIR